MMARLRLVVFTSGSLTPINRVFFERLAQDPLLDLAAVIVDDYRQSRKPLLTRIANAIREDGLHWVVFKIGAKLGALIDRAALRVADWIHTQPEPAPAPEPEPGFSGGGAGLPIHRVADIHSDESLALIRSFSPDLGVIAGTRILRDSVTTIPRHGTLNIHKRKLPEYRGGGPVGYWEVLAGEHSIGVSIHYATTRVDAGPVLAEATIPIEACDTLDSLKIKADLRGAQLYHETIRRFAMGERDGTPQDLSRGRTYRAPSDYKVWRLQRHLERKSAAEMKIARPSWIVRLRMLMQYLAVLPLLRIVRRRLLREHRAPISIFFYHLVADAPLNHMCMPLPAFIRQVEFLRRYYPLLSLDEAVERLHSGRNDQIAASITFDDGYRDNAWAIEYLRYFGIPATFFVSIGHVRDGSPFQHDRKRGYETARPMSEADVRQLAHDGFMVGSHGIHHEDFGSLSPASADRILRESRELIEATSGDTPTYFAFPKGKRGINITAETFALALKHYSFIFSAYGGYSFPQSGRRHFLRMSNPADVFELGLAMTGYTGFRQCLAGNAWGRLTEKLDPCSVGPHPPLARSDRPLPLAGEGGRRPGEGRDLRIALIAPSPATVGGQSAQAQALNADLGGTGHQVDYIPIDATFPRGLRWVRRWPYVRTLLNQALYIPSLHRIAHADVVHIFSASYWSFLLSPAPAILAANLLHKPVVLHYHSGEANDHLTRWRRSVAPFLRLVDEIVVPSTYLQRVFASHGYRARVIHNLIDTSQFQYRDRTALGPALLSVRNLEHYYDVENTVAAFACLKTRFPDATLTIAGYGSLERRLRELVVQLGIRRVRFLGRVDPAALPAIYDAADIFVNSSVLDNQPVSILEAFASGLPVISTPTGDIATMLREGEAGLLVKPGDPEAMADAVTRLLQEPGLSLRITRCAREEVKRYTSQAVREHWTNLYAEVLTRAATKPQDGVATRPLPAMSDQEN